VVSALVGGWLLGFVFGALHAFEPDHLAAMATLLASGPSGARPWRLGALWGAGHAATLVAVGGALLAWRLTLPGRVASALEGAVALLLIGLGARALAGAAQRHARNHVHLGRLTVRQPLAVGVVHGLAGSGALAALALASMPSVASAMVYLALFCAGSVAAMSLATALISQPLAVARRRRVLGAIAGGLSLMVGARMLAAL
jgi:high-affinity nickel-transport protein